MKSWWWKFSVAWPARLGDWLWALLVMAPALFISRLTWRSARHIALRPLFLAALLFFLQQILVMDMALLFFIDAAHIEVLTTVFVLATQQRLSPLLEKTAQLARTVMRRGTAGLRRFVARRRRDPATPRPRGNIPSSDDEPAITWRAALA